MNKVDIVNLLGKEFGFDSYLEISTQSTGLAFDKVVSDLFSVKDIIYYLPVELPENIHSVGRTDVDTPIESFAFHCSRIRRKNRKYDLVFVDSWHTFEESFRDLEIAMQFVANNGCIIVHDCCPSSEDLIGTYHPGAWCGQTYEAFIEFKYKYPKLDIVCVDCDYGCGIISMKPRFLHKGPHVQYDKDKIQRWDYFDENKTALLNLIESDKFVSRVSEISEIEKRKKPPLHKWIGWLFC